MRGQGQDRNGIKENGAAYPIITWKRISHFETIKRHIIVTEALEYSNTAQQALGDRREGRAASSPQIILWGTLISMMLAVQCCAFTRID
jgi:hypothetical protein